MMKAFEDVERDFQGRHVRDKTYYVPLKMKKLDVNDVRLNEVYDFEEDIVKISRLVNTRSSRNRLTVA